MNIIEKYYNQSKHEFTNNEKEILRSLIKSYRRIPNLTIHELADACYVSSSSLHRLIKKLGFRGFPDFKYKISDELSSQSIKTHDTEDYMKNIIENIEITKRLNENNIIKVANLILQKENRYCFGTGWKQKQIIDNFSTDLLYYRESFTTLRTIDDLKMASEYMGENSLILIVSLSGNAKGYVDILKKCKLNGVTIISITSDTPNPLSSLADYSLYFKDDILYQDNKHWNCITLHFLTDYIIEVIIAKKVVK